MAHILATWVKLVKEEFSNYNLWVRIIELYFPMSIYVNLLMASERGVDDILKLAKKHKKCRKLSKAVDLKTKMFKKLRILYYKLKKESSIMKENTLFSRDLLPIFKMILQKENQASEIYEIVILVLASKVKMSVQNRVEFYREDLTNAVFAQSTVFSGRLQKAVDTLLESLLLCRFTRNRLRENRKFQQFDTKTCFDKSVTMLKRIRFPSFDAVELQTPRCMAQPCTDISGGLSYDFHFHMDLKQCSRCKLAFFCSQKCFKESWNSHKLVCTQILNPK